MWVSNFITGFLLLRVPFPLTARFKVRAVGRSGCVMQRISLALRPTGIGDARQRCAAAAAAPTFPRRVAFAFNRRRR